MHGFMMVSLITHFLEIADLRPGDGSRSLNYGMDKVRVLRPVVIGDGVRLRDRITLLDVSDKGDGKRLFKTGHQIEADDGDAVIAWTNGSDVNLQRIDAAGSVVWKAPVVLSDPGGDGQSLSDLRAGVGGAAIDTQSSHHWLASTEPSQLRALIVLPICPGPPPMKDSLKRPFSIRPPMSCEV